jgi:polyhydroxybutyrate depolymerase
VTGGARPTGSGRRRCCTLVAAAAVVAFAAGSCSSGASSGSAGDAAPTTADSPVAAGPATTARRGSAPRGSAGCEQAPAVVATTEQIGDVPLSFDAGGQPRTYRLGIPPSYDPDTPVPLILDLHGSGSNAMQQSAYSRVPAKGTASGSIVVTPDATNGQWELNPTGADDDFLNALIDDIEQQYCVDLDHVHATGISLGAWKATATACQHQDRFASIAIVAEDVAPPNCTVPVVVFHGTADRIVPYGEGADPGVVVTGPNAGLPGARSNVANWASHAGCDPEPQVQRIEPDIDHWVYRGCPPGKAVEFYSIDHGGHTWPGSPVTLPGTTKTIDATDIALAWFVAHPLSR